MARLKSPGSKTDPKMLMLKFVPHGAAIWAADKSTIGVMFEVAKANIKNEAPDLRKTKTVHL